MRVWYNCSSVNPFSKELMVASRLLGKSQAFFKADICSTPKVTN
jgi:hypothetical protein